MCVVSFLTEVPKLSYQKQENAWWLSKNRLTKRKAQKKIGFWKHLWINGNRGERQPPPKEVVDHKSILGRKRVEVVCNTAWEACDNLPSSSQNDKLRSQVKKNKLRYKSARIIKHAEKRERGKLQQEQRFWLEQINRCIRMPVKPHQIKPRSKHE